MQGKKIGIALAGGGARGAYQVGALEVLKAHGYLDNIHAISGVSVGSLNACLLAMDRIDLAEKLWLDLEENDLFDTDVNWFEVLRQQNLKLLNKGVFDTSRLEKIIDDNIDFDLIRQKDVYVTTAYVADKEVGLFDTITLGLKNFFEKDGRVIYNHLKTMSNDEIKTTILASCALPVMFKPVSIHGKTFYDGGILDNESYKPLIDAGCDEIIFIDLWRFKLRHFPRKSHVDGVNIRHIHPKKSLKGIMDFDHDKIMYRFNQGKLDAKHAINQWIEANNKT